MAIKYKLPQFLEGTNLQRDKYAKWLHRKARSHARRDGRRWGKKISTSVYKQAIHEAVLDSEGLDFYTGEWLKWSLIGRYDNDEAERKGIKYRKDLALLPTVDHEDPVTQEPVFRICGMQTNDCKSNLTVERLKEFCTKFLAAQGSSARRTDPMRIVSLAEIQAAIVPEAAIEAVKAGFIAHAKGLVDCPEPTQIVFRDDRQEPHGECHVKSATWRGRPYVAVKIASGSYRNAARGLPGAGGMIVLISSDTGLPVAVLHDECWLTNVRTAAAGALAAGLKPVADGAALGVIGTGTQAEMQAGMICAHLGLRTVSVWGRNAAKAAALCQKLEAGGLAASPMDTARDVCHASAILVTTTPATKPVVHLEDVPETLHIVAVGADTPGKTELDPRILGRAHTIVTDAHEECLSNSDFGAAVRAGEVAEDSDASFGEMLALAESDPKMAEDGISVVDLTGMGVQDLAIATLVLDGLADHGVVHARPSVE